MIANWLHVALEPSAVRRRSSRSGPMPAKWDRFPFRLAKAGRNRVKPVPDLIPSQFRVWVFRAVDQPDQKREAI